MNCGYSFKIFIDSPKLTDADSAASTGAETLGNWAGLRVAHLNLLTWRKKEAFVSVGPAALGLTGAEEAHLNPVMASEAVVIPEQVPDPLWKMVAETLHWSAVAVLIAQGSQNFCDGEYSPILVAHLKKSIKKLPPIVYFQEFSADNKCILNGGTCSAMALSLAARFLILQEKNPSGSSEAILSSLLIAHATSNIAFRHLQALMNQIVVVPGCFNESLGQIARIEALCSLVGLKIDGYSGFLSYEEGYFPIFDELPAGAYLIRMLFINLDLPRQEEYGHTAILIKTPSCAFFYDSNHGLFRALSSVALMASAFLLHADSTFNFHGFRAYGLKLSETGYKTEHELDRALGIWPSLEDVAKNPLKAIDTAAADLEAMFLCAQSISMATSSTLLPCMEAIMAEPLRSP
jgi:hypothetical protein